MHTGPSAKHNHHRPVVRWLIARLALHLDVPTHAIDLTAPLAEMGVDSVRALSLAGEIEDHWDIDVDPTLVFDYPTLTHIAEFIAGTTQRELAA